MKNQELIRKYLLRILSVSHDINTFIRSTRNYKNTNENIRCQMECQN